MLHFPLHKLPPGLLTHPATSTPALDQLKRWQVSGLVVEGHEGSRPQQRHHLGGFGAVIRHVQEVACSDPPGGLLTAGWIPGFLRDRGGVYDGMAQMRGPGAELLTSFRLVCTLGFKPEPQLWRPRSICTGPPTVTTGSAPVTTTGSLAVMAASIACMPSRQTCRPTPGGATATASPWPAPAWAVNPTPGRCRPRRLSCSACARRWRPSPAAGAGRPPTSRSNR